MHTPSVTVCLHPVLLTHFLFFVFPGSPTKAGVSLTQRRSLLSSVSWPSFRPLCLPWYLLLFYFFLIDQRIMYFNKSWICPSYPCCLLHGVSLLPGSCLLQVLWPPALNCTDSSQACHAQLPLDFPSPWWCTELWVLIPVFLFLALVCQFSGITCLLLCKEGRAGKPSLTLYWWYASYRNVYQIKSLKHCSSIHYCWWQVSCQCGSASFVCQLMFFSLSSLFPWYSEISADECQ